MGNRRVTTTELTYTGGGFVVSAVDERIKGKRVAGPDMKLDLRFHMLGWVLR